MNRKQKLIRNTGAAIVYQITSLVCGFILPKFVIPYFGSATNGLINSITQFLTIITLCECGVGAVVQSALYKPLAEKDWLETSRVVISSNRFFGAIMRLLGVYVAILMVVYPYLFRAEFEGVYTAGLVLILALSYIAQYYLFLTYRLLLNADQASYIQLTAHTIALIVNTLASIILIQLGASVHMVKLASTAAFLIQPLAIKNYVDRHYQLNLKIKLKDEPIKQKWNGLAQHIASVVQGNAAVVVLTVFSTLENISVYSVYYLVVHGIRQVIVSLNTGMQAMLGNMYAKNEKETLDATYDTLEFVFHFVVTLLFSITGILLIPFIKVYTINFIDADYIQPFFGVLMTLAQATYCIRIPYEMMIKAAGHYKQTQTSSIIEAVINIVVSIGMVWHFGLVGVAFGTVAALGYRTIYLVIYLSKNILERKVGHFIKHILVNVICVMAMYFATCWIKLPATTYFAWIVMAIQVTVIGGILCLLINYFFYRNIFSGAIKMLLRRG